MGKPMSSKQNGPRADKSGGGFKGKPARGKAKFQPKKGEGVQGAGRRALPSKDRPKPSKAEPRKPLNKKEKKQMKMEKKVKKNPKLAHVQPAVQIWERIRPEAVSLANKREGIRRIYEEVKGTIADLSTNHSMSRIIQFMLAHGAPEVTKAVAQELEGKMLDLSESTFGHFISKKMIENATKDKEKLKAYYRIFKGSVARLMRHPCGSTVIDELYRAGNAHQQAALAAELYGPEFALFSSASDAPLRLGELLASEPLKRRSIISSLSSHLIPIVEKGLVDASITHRLLADYMEHAPPLAVLEAADNLASPTVMRMLHTREGTKAACLAAAALGAKGRKSFVKALKGHVLDICKDETGHVLILALLSFVDDTTLLKKFIVSELLAGEALGELCSHKHGRRVVLQLLSPDNTRYVNKDLFPLLHPTPRPVTAQDLKEKEEQVEAKEKTEAEGEKTKKPKKEKKEKQGDEKEGSDDEDAGAASNWRVEEINVSRKSGTQRRKELLGSAQGKGGEHSMAAKLVSTVTENVDAFLRDRLACDVVLEVARGGGADALLTEACGCSEGVAGLHGAIVAAVNSTEKNKEEEGDEEEEEGKPSEELLQSWWGSRALRRLIACSAEAGASDASRAAAGSFASQLYSGAIRGRAGELADTVGAGKVVAALAFCGDAATAAAVRKELQPKFGSAKAVDDWLSKFEHHDSKEGKEREQPTAAAAAEEKPKEAPVRAAENTPAKAPAKLQSPTKSTAKAEDVGKVTATPGSAAKRKAADSNGFGEAEKPGPQSTPSKFKKLKA